MNDKPKSTLGRDIYLIIFASIMSASISTYVEVRVMGNDISWIQRDLKHESRRIDRTQHDMGVLYNMCLNHEPP